MACYFIDEDNGFFQYLIQQVFNNWAKLSTVVTNEQNKDLQREMFLYTPYEFISPQIRTIPSFFKDWLVINQNKEVILDNNKVYHTLVEYNDNNIVMTLFKAYHTINNIEVGYKKL
jgi:hypothetical protein